MRHRVTLSLLLGAAALAGCGPDEVSSPTASTPDAAETKGGGLPILTTAKVGESGSFTVPEAAQNYNITLRFVNPVTPKQAADFQTAAARWEGLIHGDVADVQGSFPKNACGNSFKMPAFSGVIDDHWLERRGVELLPQVEAAEVSYDDRAPRVKRLAAALFDLLAVAFLCAPFAAVIELTIGDWSEPRVLGIELRADF